MSKENAIEFFKLSIENPELFDEAKKHTDAKNFYEALSKLAKEKDLECSAEELKEAEGMLSKLSSSELSEDDLDSVAGGAWYSFATDAYNWCKKQYDKYGDRVKETFNAAKDAWNSSGKTK